MELLGEIDGLLEDELEDDGLIEALGLREGLLLELGDVECDGDIEALIELLGLTEALIEELIEEDGDKELEGDCERLAEELGEIDALGDREALGLLDADGLWLLLEDALGDREPDGLIEGEGETEAEDEELTEELGEREAEGEGLLEPLMSPPELALVRRLASSLKGRQIATKRTSPAVTFAVVVVRMIFSSTTISLTLELGVAAAGEAFHQFL